MLFSRITKKLRINGVPICKLLARYITIQNANMNRDIFNKVSYSMNEPRSKYKLSKAKLLDAFSFENSAEDKASLCLISCRGSAVNVAQFTWNELNIILNCLLNQPLHVNQVRSKLLEAFGSAVDLTLGCADAFQCARSSFHLYTYRLRTEQAEDMAPQPCHKRRD